MLQPNINWFGSVVLIRILLASVDQSQANHYICPKSVSKSCANIRGNPTAAQWTSMMKNTCLIWLNIPAPCGPSHVGSLL
jgi:hypothetical protein